MRYTIVSDFDQAAYFKSLNKHLYRENGEACLVFKNKKCLVKFHQTYHTFSVESKNSGSGFSIKAKRKDSSKLFDELVDMFNSKTTETDILEIFGKYGKLQKYLKFS